MPGGIAWRKDAFASPTTSSLSRRDPDKITIGIIVGKTCDPILKGTQDRDWPERFRVKNNTGPNANGWGGQFQNDVALGLKMKRLHPDVFDIDFIPGEEITQARLAKNHLNFNLAYEMVNATMSGEAKHIAAVEKAFRNPASRLSPEWDMQDFVNNKTRYMKAYEKAGIPVIPTIYVMNGFDRAKVLKQVQAKGWDKFFVKPGCMGSFGLGAFHGTVKDVLADPTAFKEFEDSIDKDNYQIFLVQPYMVKPDGKRFDELRHFFIGGKWAYCVYTDGTDDNAVYSETRGERLDVTRALAERAYAEFLRVPKWRGKRSVPPIMRIDIGVIPRPGKGPRHSRMFVNELEMESCTWLVRYCPFDLIERMGPVYVDKVRECLAGLEAAGERVPFPKRTRELRQVLDARAAEPANHDRKRKEVDDESASKARVAKRAKSGGA